MNFHDSVNAFFDLHPVLGIIVFVIGVITSNIIASIVFYALRYVLPQIKKRGGDNAKPSKQ